MTYEEYIKDLYREFNEKKALGLFPNKDIYKRRRRMLEIAIELRDKDDKKRNT